MVNHLNIQIQNLIGVPYYELSPLAICFICSKTKISLCLALDREGPTLLPRIIQVSDMKILFFIFSVVLATAFCDTDEISGLGNVPCVNSRVVIEEKPDVAHFRITTDSGETLLDLNSHTSNSSDFVGLLMDVGSQLLIIGNRSVPGYSSDYYIISKQTGTENEVRIVKPSGFTVFQKALPLQSGPSPTKCVHIYGHNLIIDPAFDITQPDGFNSTSLIWSSFFGLSDIARGLVERGADVNRLGPTGAPPIAAAIFSDQPQLVEFLIRKGAVISADVGPKKVGILLAAAMLGRTNITRILIEHGADVNHASTVEKLTPLHGAASGGYCDVVELLLSKGADVNAVTTSGTTPLHLVVYDAPRHCTRQLVEAGANVNARDSEGVTPLSKTLVFQDTDDQALNILQFLLAKQKPDINTPNSKGDTLLTIANSRGFTKAAEFLKSRSSA